MIYKISMIIFLLAIGASLVYAFPYTSLIAGIAALVAGIALIMGV